MTAPYNFKGDNFTAAPRLTRPVQPGFDVIINPDIKPMDFANGCSKAMVHLQKTGHRGVVTSVIGKCICVDFGTYGGWVFTEDELLDAPRVQKMQPVTADVKKDEPTDGGMKYDSGKPRMDLLFSGCPNALDAVGEVLTFGASKYAAHSWQTVPNGDERYLAALIRHITAIGKGEEVDPESGLQHLAHVACNALFILELACKKKTGASK